MRLVFASVLASGALFSGGAAFARADAGPAIPLVVVRAGAPVAFGLVRGAGCAEGYEQVVQTALAAGPFAALLRNRGIARTVVFVPGFATSVRSAYVAARRIQSDLGRGDRVVLVDWGSAGRKTGYEHDALTARRNSPMLVPALRALKAIAPRRQLDVFAHSLGTRLVAMAIPNFAPKDGTVVTNMVMAAPDMTVAAYQRAITRKPGPFRHITLYVSRSDRALLLSEIVHLHRRLGQITQMTRSLANTDVVDASAVSRATPDGHGYAINDPLLIHDIGLTLAGTHIPHPYWRARRGTGTSGWIYEPPPHKESPPLCAAH
jgi:esterase/lipase superfamily enzyme